ncbi:hypothetical protein B0H14DRAFT_2556747 [Mycena olivaceomarginata]|nr:hypothetical protein B0H14DRAFT_2556747 [Mycena olivaceomarginata]
MGIPIDHLLLTTPLMPKETGTKTGTQNNPHVSPQAPSLSKIERRALALKKYREKNRAVLREKAREDMKRLRHRNSALPVARAAYAEQRKAHNAEYRERCRQRAYMDKYGMVSFRHIYQPMLNFYGCGHLTNIKLIDETTQFPPRKLVPTEEDEEDRATWLGKAVGRLGSGSGVGGTKRYASRVNCLQAWHARCAAGEHNHPPTASAPAPPYTGGGPSRPSAASVSAPPYTESVLPISFAGLNLSSSLPHTSPPTPVRAAPHTPPRNSSGTLLRAAPHSPLPTPPSAPIFYAVQGGSIVHRSYDAAYRQLGRMREADPSHTLHASPDHVYTALIAAGLEPNIAVIRAATHSSPTARLRLPIAEHRSDEDEDSGSEPELVLG